MCMYIHVYIYVYIYTYIYTSPIGVQCGLVGDGGQLGLVGSLKLYVSFAEYSLFYRALLQRDLYF